MNDDAKPTFGVMPWGKSAVPLQPHTMPILYFDGAPTFSHLNGVVGITLTVTGHVPTAAGGADLCASTVAFLKCNVPAAKALIAALQGAILIAAPVDSPEGKPS